MTLSIWTRSHPRLAKLTYPGVRCRFYQVEHTIFSFCFVQRETTYFLKQFPSFCLKYKSGWEALMVEVTAVGLFSPSFCSNWPLSQHIRFSLKLKLRGIVNNVCAPSGFAGRAALSQCLCTQCLLKSQERQISHLWSTAGQPLPYAWDLWLVSPAAHSHLSSPNSSRASNPFEPRLNGFWRTYSSVCIGEGGEVSFMFSQSSSHPEPS